MFKELKHAALFTLVTMLLFGGAYHGALWAVGRTVFPAQAEGSLVRRADGTIVGSRLIAQAFTRPEYFHPRPSAAGYNAASTGGSNHGPSNPDHLKEVQGRIDAIVAEDGVSPAQIPAEMVTASGAGMDPHVPPSGADLQVARVARARQVDVGKVRALVAAHTEMPTWGFLGRARVNVLLLNLALDEAFGAPAPVAGR